MPSHNCIIITMFSFQGTYWASKKKLIETSVITEISINFFSLIVNCQLKKWWAKMDSNHRPHDYQSCALASWAIGPFRLLLVESTGIEPVTSCLQGRRSPSWANPPYLVIRKWWAKMDSNHRPHDYQSCALASWAIGPYLASTSLIRYIFLYPLNWITHRVSYTLYWP